MISIVMATYNGINFIEEQLNSIMSQTKLPDEIIIQDDLSSDGTYEYVSNYSTKYPNIIWKINKNSENLGYKKNFYKAICKAKGKYIFLCDQDDIWLNNKIEKMIDVMTRNKNIKLLMSNLNSFYQENCKNKIHEEFGGFKRLKQYKNINHAVNTPRPGCSFCVERELLDEYKNKIDFNIPHDNLIWHLASLKKEAYLLNVVTMKYRRHSNNASNNLRNSKEKRLNAIQSQLYSIDFLIDNMSNNKKKLFLLKQKEVFKKRYEVVNKRDIINNIKLLYYTKYYYEIRLWLVDLNYILRK